jgi:hypothetical protein
MPERIIRLSKTQADDIAVIISIGREALTRIATVIEKLPVTIKREKVEEAIAAQFGEEKAESLGRVLFGLATVHRRNFVTIPALLDILSLPSDWDDSKRAKWQEFRPILERMLSSESVVLAAKATDLSFDVERFCVGARIITDMRPVFDLQRNRILGSTLRQTLRLEFVSLDGTVTSISVGLDADDISRLKKECDEAVHKADVTRDMLTKSGLTEIIIPGEETQ